MSKLEAFLGSQEFYELLQEYRHTDHGDQLRACDRYEAVKSAVLEATGKRKFVITSVEYGPGDKQGSYRVQPCHFPGGIKHWNGFSIPVENFGSTLLKPGTKFVLEVLTDED